MTNAVLFSTDDYILFYVILSLEYYSNPTQGQMFHVINVNLKQMYNILTKYC